MSFHVSVFPCFHACLGMILNIKAGLWGFLDFGFRSYGTWLQIMCCASLVVCPYISEILRFRIVRFGCEQKCNLSWFQNWGLAYMNRALIYWVRDWVWGWITKKNGSRVRGVIRIEIDLVSMFRIPSSWEYGIPCFWQVPRLFRNRT